MGILLPSAPTLWLLAAAGACGSVAEQCARAPAVAAPGRANGQAGALSCPGGQRSEAPELSLEPEAQEGGDSHSLLAIQRAALQAHWRAGDEAALACGEPAREPLQQYRRLEQLDLAEDDGGRSTGRTWLHELGVSRVFGIVLCKRADSFQQFVDSLGLQMGALDVRRAVEPPPHLQAGRADPAWAAVLEAAGVIAAGHGGGLELAGSLSHALLLREFAESGASPDDLALVFEDDIEPVAGQRALVELQRRVAQVLAALHGPWAEPNATGAGWVNLGRCLDRCEMDVPVGSSGLVRSFSPVCGHAYLVTRAGARAIVNNALPVQFPQVALDDAIVQNALRKGLLEGLSVTPRLFTQRKGDNTQSRLEASAGIKVSDLVECWRDSQTNTTKPEEQVPLHSPAKEPEEGSLLNMPRVNPKEDSPPRVPAAYSKKDLGVALCIAGQLSRTELDSKAVNIVAPLAAVTNVDVFAALATDDVTSFSNTRFGPSDACTTTREEDFKSKFGSHFVAGNFSLQTIEEVRLQHFQNLYLHVNGDQTSLERKPHVSNVLRQLRHLRECADLIISHEEAAGGRYAVVVKVRDDTLALNRVVAAELLSVAGVRTKSCDHFGGINDKVMIIQRRWLEQTMGSFYPVVRRAMFARDPGELAGLSRLLTAQNTEQLEGEVLEHLGVPYRDGRSSADVIPFVDGRCAFDDAGDAHWCVVEEWKDCWPSGGRGHWDLDVACQAGSKGGVQWFPKAG